MAQFIPSLDDIRNLTVKPEEGELYLLEFLNKVLDDTFEVYFNPYMNGDRPDVIIMKERQGVMIIEVKDWNLAHYYIDNFGDWRLRENNAYITSPFLQVEIYKNKLQNMNYRFLYENFFNKNIYGVIRTAVYFHCESRGNVLRFVNNNIGKYVEIIGRDSLNFQFFNNLLS